MTATQLGLEIDARSMREARLADGSAITIYGTCTVEFTLKDSIGRVRRFTDRLRVIDREDSRPIIGFPHLSRNAYVIDCEAQQFRFKYEVDKFNILTPKKFRKELDKPGAVCYLAHITPAAPDKHGNFPSDEKPDLAEIHISHIDEEESTPSNKTLPPELPENEIADLFAQLDAIPKPVAGVEHAIETTGMPPRVPIYNLSNIELEELRRYLDDALKKGWIQPSTSEAGAGVLFVPKKDGSLRLCVDYRGLNKITRKNRYPLPLINEILDRLSGSTYFTKLDLKDAYYRIAIKPEDRWKTAFRTRYGHFEYAVMPFGLTNAPATFQEYIHRALAGLLDITCIVYLDDILIYSKTREGHAEHVRAVFERLRQYDLYLNRNKCEFFVQQVDFLGYQISEAGVQMEPSRVKAIQNWPTPQTHKDIQVFIGFTNFYRRFIHQYSKITAPITSLLKGSKDGSKTGPLDWSDEANQAFSKLKTAFTQAPVLAHFDPEKPIRLITDASGYAFAGILLQPDERNRFHPVAFWSRKMQPAELNWPTHDTELNAIAESITQWRHYLEGSKHAFEVLSDHSNLQGFSKQHTLSRRQARVAIALSGYDFTIKHIKGEENPADGLTRRWDYAPGKHEESSLLPTLQRKLGLNEVSLVRPAPGSLMGDSQGRQGGPLAGSMLSASSQHDPDGEPADLCLISRVMAQTVTRHAAATALRTPPHQRAPCELAAMSLRGRQKRKSRGSDKPRPTNLSSGQPAAQNTPHPRATTVRNASDQMAETSRRAEDEPSDPAAPNPRMPSLTLSESLESLLRVAQVTDPETKELLEQTKRTETPGSGPFGLRKGLLTWKNRVYVPSQQGIRNEILYLCHDHPYAGHFGVERTAELIKRDFFWKGLDAEVQQYVSSCHVCQEVKFKRHKPYGELQSLPIPEKPFQEVSMDFIVGLPPSRLGAQVFDSILVIVDRFTKFSLYIPTTKKITAEALAQLVERKLLAKYGLPEGILSDRGSVFTSDFWYHYCHLIGAARRMSTAFHPQTDGQTERQNQQVKQYLQSYVDDQHSNWATQLHQAQFTSNAAMNATIKMSPFEALHGFKPAIRNVPAGKSGEPITVRDRIEKIEDLRGKLARSWEQAAKAQATGYNRRHQPIHFKEGELVMMDARNLRLRLPSKKLAPRFLGPFRIAEAVGKQAYRLHLPTSWKIHDVINVSRLEKYNRRKGSQEPSLPEGIMLPGGEEEWEIEKLLGKRKRKGKHEYLVRWVGWPPEYDQWVADEDLHAEELVKAYEETPQPSKKKKKTLTTPIHCRAC